jgi:hypothetical protein
MGGGSLYITKFDQQRAHSIKKLIEIQPYIDQVFILDNFIGKFDGVNLNRFRKYWGPKKNIVTAHLKVLGLKDDTWKEGWLTVPEVEKGNYSVINCTTRYEDPDFDWAKEVEYLYSISDKVYFVGYEGEYNWFQNIFKTDAIFHNCDFLEAAMLIKGAKMFTGNYSAMSAITMGLGGEYRIIQAPGWTCSSLNMPRETILNENVNRQVEKYHKLNQFK